MEATWLGVEASLEGTTSAHSEAVTAIGAAVAALLLLGTEKNRLVYFIFMF